MCVCMCESNRDGTEPLLFFFFPNCFLWMPHRTSFQTSLIILHFELPHSLLFQWVGCAWKIILRVSLRSFVPYLPVLASMATMMWRLFYDYAGNRLLDVHRLLSRVFPEALGYVPRRSFNYIAHHKLSSVWRRVRTVRRWCIFELNSTSSPMNNELPFFTEDLSIIHHTIYSAFHALKIYSFQQPSNVKTDLSKVKDLITSLVPRPGSEPFLGKVRANPPHCWTDQPYSSSPPWSTFNIKSDG